MMWRHLDVCIYCKCNFLIILTPFVWVELQLSKFIIKMWKIYFQFFFLLLSMQLNYPGIQIKVKRNENACKVMFEWQTNHISISERYFIKHFHFVLHCGAHIERMCNLFAIKISVHVGRSFRTLTCIFHWIAIIFFSSPIPYYCTKLIQIG